MIGQTRSRAPCASNELGHHGPNERQATGDAQAAKEVGQCAGDAKSGENLPAGGPVEFEVTHQIGLNALQAQGGVADDGKEGHQTGAKDHREGHIFDPNDDQGGDGHNGRDLEQDGIGKKRHLDQWALHKDKGDHRAHNGGQAKGQEGDLDGGVQSQTQRQPVFDQGLEHQNGGGHQIGWELHHHHRAVPKAKEDQTNEERKEVFSPGHVFESLAARFHFGVDLHACPSF